MENKEKECLDRILNYTAPEGTEAFDPSAKKSMGVVHEIIKSYVSTNEDAYELAMKIKPEMASALGIELKKVKSIGTLSNFCEEGALRTFKFKVNERANRPELLREISEGIDKATSHFKPINDFFCEWLLKPCSEAYEQLLENGKDADKAYMTELNSYGDEPLHSFFKTASDKSRDNSLYYLYQSLHGAPKETLCGIPSTSWFQKGVFKNITSNFKTKFSSLTISAKSFVKSLGKDKANELIGDEKLEYDTLCKIEAAQSRNRKLSAKEAINTLDKILENENKHLKDNADKNRGEDEKEIQKKKKILSKIEENNKIIDYVKDQKNAESLMAVCEKNILDQLVEFLKNGGIKKKENQSVLSTEQFDGKKLTTIDDGLESEPIYGRGLNKDPLLSFKTGRNELLLDNHRLFEKLFSSYVKDTDRKEISDSDLICSSLSYERKNGSLYVILQIILPEYKKTTSSEESWENPNSHIGLDVNISHALLVGNRNSAKEYTETPDGGLKPMHEGDKGLGHGYINLYREMKSTGLLEIKNKDTQDAIDALANAINFGVLEYGTLVENMFQSVGKEPKSATIGDKTFEYQSMQRGKSENPDYLSLRRAMKKVRDEYRLKSSADKECKYAYDYVAHNYELLNDFGNFMLCQANLSYAQKAYDNAAKFGDSDDKRRILDAFRKSELGEKLYNATNEALSKVQNRIAQIKRYAVNTLYRNGINHIALEDLDSSQMKANFKMPSAESILKYHGFLGLTKEECEKKAPCEGYDTNTYNEYVNNKKYYKPVFVDGKLSDLELTTKGDAAAKKPMLWSKSLHAIKFAEFKDVVLTMSSDRELHVRIANKAYTSQLDSKTGKVYMEEISEETKSGKTRKRHVITDKHNIRPKQHIHENGLNGDVNAGGNILNAVLIHKDIFLDRKSFGMEGYRTPNASASKLTQYGIPTLLKKKDGGKFVTIFQPQQKTENKRKPAKSKSKM